MDHTEIIKQPPLLIALPAIISLQRTQEISLLGKYRYQYPKRAILKKDQICNYRLILYNYKIVAMVSFRLVRTYFLNGDVLITNVRLYIEKDNLQLLNKHQIQLQNEIHFSKASNSFLEINLALGIVNQTDAVKFQSGPIIKKELESLVIRTIYSTNLNIDQERSAAILVYQLQTTIYIRFILMLVLLLQADKLFDLMSHFTGCIKVVLFAIISLGFISSDVAIVSSAVAIYLTLSKIHNANAYGIILSLLFLIGGFTLKFEITAISILIYTISISLKKIVANFGLIQLGTLIGIISTGLLMWNLKWQFYIYLTPVLLLGALLSTQQQKSSPNIKYDLINVDQQEDVLYKIKRQLAS